MKREGKRDKEREKERKIERVRFWCPLYPLYINEQIFPMFN